MIKDSEVKQNEANEILDALARAGLPWDPKAAIGACEGFEEMTDEQKYQANLAAVAAFEKIREGLHQSGEHEIADRYFKHPRQLDDLRNYLPK